MGLVNVGHLLLTRRLRSWFPAQQRHSITKLEPVWQPVLKQKTGENKNSRNTKYENNKYLFSKTILIYKGETIRKTTETRSDFKCIVTPRETGPTFDSWERKIRCVFFFSSFFSPPLSHSFPSSLDASFPIYFNTLLTFTFNTSINNLLTCPISFNFLSRSFPAIYLPALKATY